MTTISADDLETLDAHWRSPATLRAWFATVDHKRIGIRYLVTAFAFFVVGGVEALVIRTQLAEPQLDVVGPGAYSQLFSMHGITMIFLFITPMLSGFGNFLVPLMIGARDMAFPRLNALSYWVYIAAGLFMYSSVPIGQAPNNGWFNYAPLTAQNFSPHHNIDFYALGLIFLGISTTAGAINFIVTIFKLRAPGMSLDRLPLFCWAILAMAFSVVFALPALTGANVLLELQRLFGFHFFDPAGGGDPVLWQHLFWIFGHPDVYIIFIPAVGIVSSIIPVMARRRIVGYPWLVLATVTTAFVGFGVWVHHMFAVGLPSISLGFFAAASTFIGIPSAVQIVAWLATLWTGRPRFDTPLLFCLGFVLLFVIGGVTGVMFSVISFDQQVTDSYFIVAHFHYVLFGGAVFPVFAGLYYWMPKFTGRRLRERLGRVSFWLMFVGFNVAFFPMHIAGLLGMRRRVFTYRVDDGVGLVNLISSIGAFVLACGVLVTLYNIADRRRWVASGPDPWHGDTLEWTIPSPPPEYNFARVPHVESLHPAWDHAAEPATDDPLVEGHLTLETSLIDGDPDAVLEMPEPSLLPIGLAAAMLVMFSGALLEWWWLAGAGLAATGVAVVAWQWAALTGAGGRR